jgi:MerR family copper efflux transcriptional regulator
VKVSELADRTRCTTKAVRFYEAEGVLPPPRRLANGYREYTEEDVCRVRVLVALRGLGLGVAESGRLALPCSEGRCEDMADELEARVAERTAAVAVAIAELQHVEAKLANLARVIATGAPQTSLCLNSAISKGVEP